MIKTSLTIDLNKVDMTKVVVKKYKNAVGQEVEVRELKLDLVQLKEPKFVKDFPNSVMKKVAFLVEPQTKQEREAKAKNVFVGDGFIFEPKTEGGEDAISYPSDDTTPEDIPF